MIGKLTGIIDNIEDEYMIIDVNGVGYIVYCSSHTLSNLEVGTAYSILIDMHVKEDGSLLYGFSNNLEKLCFKHLISVQGVGGKVALAILSKLVPEQVIYAIKTSNIATFKSIIGIGPKLATRIVTELKSNKQIMGQVLQSYIEEGVDEMKNTNSVNTGSSNQLVNDAISAIANLGFNKNSMSPLIIKLYNSNPGIDLESLIKLFLSNINK